MNCSKKSNKNAYKKLINVKNLSFRGVRFIAAGLFFCMTIAIAKPFSAEIDKVSYSPYADQSYPANVYWGDTHLHTNLSMDSYIFNNRRLGLDDAYRFARGDSVIAHNGMTARLRRPLDFLVVADHATDMGFMLGLEGGDPELLKTKAGRYWLQRIKNVDEIAITDSDEVARQSSKIYGDWKWRVISDEAFQKTVWEQVAAKADKYNDSGKFTAFTGYEWTSWGKSLSGNLHRVVIFKDNAERTKKIVPFSQYDSSNPEDLWAYMAGYEQKTGGGVLAIPHNGNVSNGNMFALTDFNGIPLNHTYAKARSRWEPLYEVTQLKGNSESHPLLSSNDDFADYEIWDSFSGKSEKWEDSERGKKQFEYARSALKLGLKQKSLLGVNPFKFGLIGSTDAHTSLSTADDNNFFGKFSEPYPRRILDPVLKSEGVEDTMFNWEVAASGYAAVWARENTRDALFASMKRKEVYASTGPRMTVRFFGGWDYQADDAFKSDLARIGYDKGVPMGGDLTSAPDDKAPSFLIRAVKDPDGANLDRIQVIKGWHDKQGDLHEKIYDVALSDHREVNWRGKVKPVGNTVDIPDASYTNTIGDPELAVMWQDPDFDKDELAFYYVRVLEIPTPRWTAYDAKFFELKNIPKEIPMVTQERAYTSPIWYSPTK